MRKGPMNRDDLHERVDAMAKEYPDVRVDKFHVSDSSGV